MMRSCPVCDYDFQDGDKIVAVILSEFKIIDSGIAYAIKIPSPDQCLELIHRECYSFPDGQIPEDPPYMDEDSLS